MVIILEHKVDYIKPQSEASHLLFSAQNQISQFQVQGHSTIKHALLHTVAQYSSFYDSITVSALTFCISRLRKYK